MKIRPNAAARTVEADIRPIAEISQRVGIPIEAATFLGASPIRRLVEDWTVDHLERTTEKAVKFAVDHNLPVDVRHRRRDSRNSTEKPSSASTPPPSTTARARSFFATRSATQLRKAPTTSSNSPSMKSLLQAAPTSASTGTATTIAASPSPTRSPQSPAAQIRFTRPQTRSANASATRRWSSCSSICA